MARIPGTTFSDQDPPRQKGDKLEKIFLKQRQFMDLLVQNDKMPEFPLDLTTKPGQRLFKETAFNTIEELMEACYTLKNRMHKLSDDAEVDWEHFREELCADTLAFYVELLILAGITPDELYAEYSRKNAIVQKRLEEGY